MIGFGVKCSVCQGELQDMTGAGEHPPWALCRCPGVWWRRTPAGRYERVEDEPQPS
jgi:hypothetical protein